MMECGRQVISRKMAGDSRNRMINSAGAKPEARIAYNFTQIDDLETEIEIYDIISGKKSYDWWTDREGTEVTPTDFKEKLSAVITPNVTVRINSTGGEVSAANVISVAIQEAVEGGKKITCKVDGVCASAATLIAASCSEVIIHKSALMMIHNPMIFTWGYYDSVECSKMLNMLNSTKEAILTRYIDKTGLGRQKLSNMMDAETWFTGQEAVDNGFADRLMFDSEIKVSDVFNNIRLSVINTALDIPEPYMAAINQADILPEDTSNTKGESGMPDIKTLDELKTQFPQLVNELAAEIRNEIGDNLKQEGIEAERARIREIDGMGDKIQPHILNRAKYETFVTAEAAALEAVKEDAFINTVVLNALTEETAAQSSIPSAANGGVNVAGEINMKSVVSNKAEEIARKHLKTGKEA